MDTPVKLQDSSETIEPSSLQSDQSRYYSQYDVTLAATGMMVAAQQFFEDVTETDDPLKELAAACLRERARAGSAQDEDEDDMQAQPAASAILRLPDDARSIVFSSDEEANERVTSGVVAYLDGFKPNLRDRGQTDHSMLGRYSDSLADAVGSSLATQDFAMSINLEGDSAIGRARVPGGRNRAGQPAGVPVAREGSTPSKNMKKLNVPHVTKSTTASVGRVQRHSSHFPAGTSLTDICLVADQPLEEHRNGAKVSPAASRSSHSTASAVELGRGAASTAIEERWQYRRVSSAMHTMRWTRMAIRMQSVKKVLLFRLAEFSQKRSSAMEPTPLFRNPCLIECPSMCCMCCKDCPSADVQCMCIGDLCRVTVPTILWLVLALHVVLALLPLSCVQAGSRHFAAMQGNKSIEAAFEQNATLAAASLRESLDWCGVDAGAIDWQVDLDDSMGLHAAAERLAGHRLWPAASGGLVLIVMFYLSLIATSCFLARGQGSAYDDEWMDQKDYCCLVYIVGYRPLMFVSMMIHGEHTATLLSAESACIALLFHLFAAFGLMASVTWDSFLSGDIDVSPVHDNGGLPGYLPGYSLSELQQTRDTGAVVIAAGALLLVGATCLCACQAVLAVCCAMKQERTMLPLIPCIGCNTAASSAIVGTIVAVIAIGHCMITVQAADSFGEALHSCMIRFVYAAAVIAVAMQSVKICSRIWGVLLWSLAEDLEYVYDELLPTTRIVGYGILLPCMSEKSAPEVSLLVYHSVLVVPFALIAAAASQSQGTDFLLGANRPMSWSLVAVLCSLAAVRVFLGTPQLWRLVLWRLRYWMGIGQDASWYQRQLLAMERCRASIAVAMAWVAATDRGAGQSQPVHMHDRVLALLSRPIRKRVLDTLWPQDREDVGVEPSHISLDECVQKHEQWVRHRDYRQPREQSEPPPELQLISRDAIHDTLRDQASGVYTRCRQRLAALIGGEHHLFLFFEALLNAIQAKLGAETTRGGKLTREVDWLRGQHDAAGPGVGKQRFAAVESTCSDTDCRGMPAAVAMSAAGPGGSPSEALDSVAVGQLDYGSSELLSTYGAAMLALLAERYR